MRIADVAVKGISPDHLDSMVSCVNQDVVLFDGTVRDNVTLWNAQIDEQAVRRALRDAAILDEVTSRPGMYDTPVGENGCNFSGGQRQLLELARSLVTNPDVRRIDPPPLGSSIRETSASSRCTAWS